MNRLPGIRRSSTAVFYTKMKFVPTRGGINYKGTVEKTEFDEKFVRSRLRHLDIYFRRLESEQRFHAAETELGQLKQLAGKPENEQNPRELRKKIHAARVKHHEARYKRLHDRADVLWGELKILVDSFDHDFEQRRLGQPRSWKIDDWFFLDCCRFENVFQRADPRFDENGRAIIPWGDPLVSPALLTECFEIITTAKRKRPMRPMKTC